MKPDILAIIGRNRNILINIKGNYQSFATPFTKRLKIKKILRYESWRIEDLEYIIFECPINVQHGKDLYHELQKNGCTAPMNINAILN